MSDKANNIPWPAWLVVSIAVAIIGITPSFIKNHDNNETKRKPSATYNELILGKWKNEKNIKIQGIKITIKENIEYLPDKTITSQGKLEISGNKKSNGNISNITVDYDYYMSGKWSINKQKIVSNFIDLKTFPKSITRNGIKLKLSTTEISSDKINGIKIDNLIPKGLSTSQRIISLTSYKMELKSGDKFIIYSKI